MFEKLAIIIPAYKSIFLEKTLDSFANQTNKNFRIYVGDDNSPHDLKAICHKFSSQLEIVYLKFKNNIGAKNIVNQWIRCIEMSKDEPWIWLFSDDDIADNICVEKFYATIEKDNSYFDVYRFNTRIINDNDQIIGSTNESPFIDTSLNMAYHILLGERGNSMPDHIFSRAIYQKYGFVKTDWAQGADWATSILFSSDKGICTIPEAKVNWRLGNYNISGTVQKDRSKKLLGHIQFLLWVTNHFQFLEKQKNTNISYKMFFDAACINLEQVIRNHYKGLSLVNYCDIYQFFRTKNSFFYSLCKTTIIYYRTWKKLLF
jgi:glycosyltransferase involved in cell wall biosynthesis